MSQIEKSGQLSQNIKPVQINAKLVKTRLNGKPA